MAAGPGIGAAIRLLVDQLAIRVNRSELHNALIESKLVDRQVQRSELRQRYPDPQAWARSVSEALAHPSTEGLALRALSHVVREFARDPALDHRVDVAIRKAVMAAERNDVRKLQRELERLDDLGKSGKIPELTSPIAVVYIAATTASARRNIESLERGGVAPDQTAAQMDGDDPLTPSASESESSGVGTFDPVALSRLAALMGRLEKISMMSLEPGVARWTRDDLLGLVPAAPSHIDWPSTSLVSKKLRDIGAQLFELASLLNIESLAPGDVVQFRSKLEQLGNIAASSAVLRTELDKYAATCASLVAKHPSMPPLTIAEWSTAMELLKADDTFAIGVSRVNDLLLRQRAEHDARVRAALEVVDAIADTTKELSERDADALRDRTKEALSRLDQDALISAATSAKVRAEEMRAIRDKARSAAQALMKLLSEHGESLDARQVEELMSVTKNRSQIHVALAQVQAHVEALSRTLTRARTITSPQPAAPVSQVPITPLTLPLDGFAPRNRFSKIELSNSGKPARSAQALISFLHLRAVDELKKGSIVGVVDHALDMLLLAARGGDAGLPWAYVAMNTLLLLPGPSANVVDWEAIAERASSTDVTERDLEAAAAILLQSPRFDVAVEERLGHAELQPFATTIAKALYMAAVHSSPWTLEDVARGIARSARYGSATIVEKMICELAAQAGVQDSTIGNIGRFVAQISAQPRATLRPPAGPYWMTEGLGELGRTVAAVAETRASRSPGKQKPLHVQVPESIRRSGGFSFSAASERLDIALLVSNPKASGRSIYVAELVIPVARNRWLARDIVAPLGSLEEDARLLVPLTLPLVSEISDSKYAVHYELRWREANVSESRTQDDRLEISLTPFRAVTIDDYRGASGKPLLLEGDTLKLSSKSVQDSLREVLAGLRSGTGVAVLLVGRRRRGKTSILETIRVDADVAEKYLVVSDVWEDLPFRTVAETFRHLGGVFDRAARRLEIRVRSLEHELATSPSQPWQVIQDWIDDVERALPTQKRLLLLIDEFQKWIAILDAEPRTRVLSVLRGLFNRPANAKLAISIVLSGLSNITQYVKASADFKNAFRTFEIRPFTQQETEALVTSNPSIEFDKRAVQTIRDLSGGNPFLVNLLGSQIASRLRELGRPYCLREDVEIVVRSELEDRQNSRVWSFLQYLLKEGEEDHASEINELPALVGLAWTLRSRGSSRSMVAAEEIVEQLAREGVPCAADALQDFLGGSVENEILVTQNARYAFASRWLAEWLAVIHNDKPLPIRKDENKELVLNRYRIREMVASGGQSTVFLAEDTKKFNSTVVLKIYPRTHSSGASAAVKREAEAVSSIDHTAVVRCLDWGTDPDKGDVLVLERAKGTTLRELLRETPAWAGELVGASGNFGTQMRFIEQLVAAVRECHSAGVVHKDIKPENIMVDQSAGTWVAKLIDFGIATRGEPSNDAPTVGLFTPGYAPPERYMGEPRRAPADIYAVGVVAYELLTGLSPFPTEAALLVDAQLREKYVRVAERRAEVPSRVAELLHRMLSAEPARRPNALTLADELNAALQSTSWEAELAAGIKAYGDGDAVSAFEHLRRSVFSAPDKDRHGSPYGEALELLVDAARECNVVLDVSGQLIQPVLDGVLCSIETVARNRGQTLLQLLNATLDQPIVDAVRRDARATTLDALCEILLNNSPSISAAPAVLALLHRSEDPLVWRRRESLFSIVVSYLECGYLDVASIVQWCIRCSARLRQEATPLSHCQLWLRRVERLGATNNHEFKKEVEAVARLAGRTSTPSVLPPLPTQQESPAKCVGSDEKGHLNVDRIQRWVAQLLRLHPYVEAVRRVRKDPGIPPSPTRLLEVTNLSQHVAALSGIAETRIVPAVLDASYCVPSAVALRINLVLPAGTTLSQREAAMDVLRADTSLFGDDA